MGRQGFGSAMIRGQGYGRRTCWKAGLWEDNVWDGKVMKRQGYVTAGLWDRRAFGRQCNLKAMQFEGRALGRQGYEAAGAWERRDTRAGLREENALGQQRTERAQMCELWGSRDMGRQGFGSARIQGQGYGRATFWDGWETGEQCFGTAALWEGRDVRAMGQQGYWAAGVWEGRLTGGQHF